MRMVIIFLSISFFTACNFSFNPPSNPFKKSEKSPETLPLNTLKLPNGFKIEAYAEDVKNARSIKLSKKNTLFVGTRGLGNVYALRDSNKDLKIDQKITLFEDGNMPNGVALKDGDLYVAEVNRILKFEDIENNLTLNLSPEVVYDQYPEESHHGWKFIDFGPDGKLYVPVGAPCNICESEEEVFNSITSLDVDTKEMKILHNGIRNTVGFNWHPETKELWFSDNGRDMMGDDIPGCELNRVTGTKQHFGYPYCHQGDLIDPKLGDGKSCDDYVAPVQVLGPHVAPLGIEFYQSGMFPEAYQNKVFIAEHGSWNRSKKSGYRITTVTLDENYNAVAYEPFIYGWLNEETDDVWGRPVDMEWMDDGSLLISDDFANAVYRVSYSDGF